MKRGSDINCWIATSHANTKYQGKLLIFTTDLVQLLGAGRTFSFLFQSPCMSWPCQNNGTCAAHYEKNSYVCVCAKGYTGKYCETGNVLAFCNETQ